jgi:diaminopimelate epimerase
LELHLAAASGNVFGYLWADEAKGCSGEVYAKMLCPRGRGFGLDGLFLMQRPGTGPWGLEHWDTDGSKSFCSNGSRAALAIPGTPEEALIEAVSSGERILLRRDGEGVGIRMPEGAAFGLRTVPMATAFPAGFGWIGNPQLVLRVPLVADVDLPVFAPPLRHHAAVPGGTNVSVVEVLAPGEARIRSWERGVEGETLCCGTGSAVAAAWLAQTEGVQAWRLHTAGGETVSVSLVLDAEGAWHDLWLSGPVRRLGTVHPEPSLLLRLQG